MSFDESLVFLYERFPVGTLLGLAISVVFLIGMWLVDLVKSWKSK